MTNTNPKRFWTPYELNQLSRSNLQELTQTVVDEIPVEYLTGQVDFCGWTLRVSPAVLIPRIETEQIIDLALETLKELSQKQLQIVDVGCGSGAIGLSLWRQIILNHPQLRVDLSLYEISLAAIEITNKNLELLTSELSQKLPESIPQITQSDLLAQWPKTKKIDLIIANLPYIPSQNLKNLPESVANFEPRLALDGGLDGLRLVDKLLLQAKDLLTVAGVIWLELDETHNLTQLSKIRPEFSYQGVSDCFNKFRFVKAQLKQ